MLTGEQLKTIRQIAGFTKSEVAKEMLWDEHTIDNIENDSFERFIPEYHFRYYEMSLKNMINDLVDPDLHRICLDLLHMLKAECTSKWLVVYKDPKGTSLTIEGEYRTFAEAESMACEMKNEFPYAEYLVLKDLH